MPFSAEIGWLLWAPLGCFRKQSQALLGQVSPGASSTVHTSGHHFPADWMQPYGRDAELARAGLWAESISPSLRVMGGWHCFSQKDRLPVGILSKGACAWEELFPPDYTDDSPGMCCGTHCLPSASFARIRGWHEGWHGLKSLSYLSWFITFPLACNQVIPHQ